MPRRPHSVPPHLTAAADGLSPTPAEHEVRSEALTRLPRLTGCLWFAFFLVSDHTRLSSPHPGMRAFPADETRHRR